MTREEAIEMLKNVWIRDALQEDYDALDMAIKALERESKTEQFAIWVAKEIFDEQWEYNKDAFDELACRKLSELGIVKEKGGKWEFDPQEREGDK